MDEKNSHRSPIVAETISQDQAVDRNGQVMKVLLVYRPTPGLRTEASVNVADDPEPRDLLVPRVVVGRALFPVRFFATGKSARPTLVAAPSRVRKIFVGCQTPWTQSLP